jgi:threonine dehydratase
MGIQVQGEDKNRLQDMLKNMGYHYWEETTNPAYRLFAGTDEPIKIS